MVFTIIVFRTLHSRFLFENVPQKYKKKVFFFYVPKNHANKD